MRFSVHNIITKVRAEVLFQYFIGAKQWADADLDVTLVDKNLKIELILYHD